MSYFDTYRTEMIDGTSAMEPDNGTVFVALLFPPEKNALLAPYFASPPDQNGTYREKRPTRILHDHLSLLQYHPLNAQYSTTQQSLAHMKRRLSSS